MDNPLSGRPGDLLQLCPSNRLTKAKRAAGSTISYTYNAHDQITEAENLCSCGFLISNYKYTYDDAGLIVGETAKECLFASNKDYGHKGGPDGECVHVSDNPWQNQNPEWQTTKRTFKYDDNGQLIECKEDKGMFDKTSYTYEYDNVGNRTLAKKYEMFEYRTDKTTYAYTADNQMVSAVVCKGNLTKRYTFKYDANGNLTQECLMNRAEVTYQYDTENRLKAVNDKQKLLMAASYDGDGNRTFQLNYNPEAECGYGKNVSGEVFMPENSKNADGSLTAEGDLFSYICSATGRAYDLTEYVNDTNRQYTEVLTAYTVNSGATESYSYNGNQRLSRNNIWNEARGVDHNETSYYLYDGRGSVTANTWQNGMVTNVYQYDPYGQVMLGSTEHTDFYGYNAERYNPNTGLEYLRARYYNANMGRFFQEDTHLGDITNPLTLNRYAYVNNSPLNYTDPSGHAHYYRNERGGKTTQDVYDNLPSYLTGDTPENNRNPYVTSQQNDWYKNINQNKNVEVKSLKELWEDAKSQLNKLIEKAKSSSVYKICGIYGDGFAYGTKDFWRILESNTLGKLLLYFGNDSHYYPDEEQTSNLQSTFNEVAQKYNVGWKEWAENYDLFYAGYKVGFLLSALEIIAVICGGVKSSTGGGQSVVLQDTYGNTYSIELPAEVVEEVLGKVGAEVIIQQSMGNSSKGESNTPDNVNYDSKQVGKKYGEHMKDYPDMKDYTEYKDYADEIFKSPDQIIHDAKNGEFYYTKGNDLLRIKENGDFVSLYPGAESGRVLDAISNGGVIWP